MKYKLIAADMDGTLLNDDSVISERTRAAIIKAIEAGALFVTATGRAIQGAEIINDLFEEDMPFVVFNGACAIMGKSRKTLFKVYMDFTLAKEVVAQGKSRSVCMVVWTDIGLRKILMENPPEEYLDYNLKYNQVDYKQIIEVDEIADESIYKVLWFGNKEQVREYQEEMNGYFGGRVNCCSSLPELLEFVSPEADKGIALEEIGKHFGIDRSEMIAVGDGYNDISMLKYAGLGIAMGNAPDDVKAACDEVTLSNNNDGLAAVIEKYILCDECKGNK